MMEGLDATERPPNPTEPTAKLEPPTSDDTLEQAVQPQQTTFAEDSAVTKAEKYERHGEEGADGPSKRVKLDHPENEVPTRNERIKGVAPIKPEFLVHVSGDKAENSASTRDDDAAEGAAHQDGARGEGKKGKKNKGQNTGRKFNKATDEVGLCSSRVHAPEFSPGLCQFGESCRYEHDLRKYLKECKREDLTTFEGICPVWKANGKCGVGWTCRFVGSHMEERDTPDGKKELALVEIEPSTQHPEQAILPNHMTNNISMQQKADLMKHRFQTPKADKYIKHLDTLSNEPPKQSKPTKSEHRNTSSEDSETATTTKNDNRASYREPPFLTSEKRRLYFGAETPVLAPLTTQGNLPFRRLCVSLGAQATYSEMAMSMPLIQGSRSEWALLRAHSSETTPPACDPQPPTIISDYDHSKDLKFGAQIAANKPWLALKTTEVLTALCPHLRVIDLNAGCPIDLVFRQGAGSALLDNPGKLDKILRGMNAVSGEVPVSVKIRMGTKDNKPNALKLVNRLVYGAKGGENEGKPSGVAAITLHGRSRQQRYTRSADWSYIASCASLIEEYNRKGDELADTIRESDERDLPNGGGSGGLGGGGKGKVFFLGNGDCYSHTDYFSHLTHSKVDSIMIARGALIKPWIFEEIATQQYLDKSATERLAYISQFVKNGLECWGSDERGVGTTRRFLLEWLSFSYRYVPLGILEYLPPNLQDRPPRWRGRNELESLLGSADFRDWVRISEMFLGPAHKDFVFQPKHKSNSYEIEAEG